MWYNYLLFNPFILIFVLILASLYGYLDIVNALIGANASLYIKENFNGATALTTGKIIYYLFNLLIFIFSMVFPVLILASYNGNLDIVNALISANANLNIQNNLNQTALYFG